MPAQRRAIILPSPLQHRLESAARDFIGAERGMDTDFSSPAGEPALSAPDSVSWQIFKNPLSLFIGGVAAVILELAEPRVRAGVWGHTRFRDDPLQRIRRTGLAAMMTVYGPRSRAERMIARVRIMHARVRGITPDGITYRADDPELLSWVHATASYGFLHAYHTYVHPLDEISRSRFFAESVQSSRLYGATGAPASEYELDMLFASMRDRLQPSSVIFEFLDIVRATRLVPGMTGVVQQPLVKAAVALLPPWVRDRLQLAEAWNLPGWQAHAIRRAGALADRIPLRAGPAAQACRRLGLPESYLYGRR